MKIAYRKIVLALGLFLSLISCKAQQTYPLLTPINIAPDMSHLKDTNNELQSFTGTYFSTYNGNQITLYIEKENDKLFNMGNKKIYRDVISVRYIVKNASGNILQDTKNMVFPAENLMHTIYSLWITENGKKITLIYNGTNCGVGWGDIFIKKINATQISWEYRPDDITTTSQSCPGNQDTTIYLPETKDLIFTKQ